jgi:hypothetical protein
MYLELHSTPALPQTLGSGSLGCLWGRGSGSGLSQLKGPHGRQLRALKPTHPKFHVPCKGSALHLHCWGQPVMHAVAWRLPSAYPPYQCSMHGDCCTTPARLCSACSSKPSLWLPTLRCLPAGCLCCCCIGLRAASSRSSRRSTQKRCRLCSTAAPAATAAT